jgi:putative ABC transport system permease protein
MDWSLSLRNLTRHPLRSALSVAGIAVASALLADMVMLRGGLERSFADLLLKRGYQVRLTPRGTLPLDSEATIPGASAIRRVLGQDAAVASVAPVLGAAVYGTPLSAGGAWPGHAERRETLFGYGIDPTAQGLYDVLRGSDLAPHDSQGVLLGEPAARRLGVTVGDSIRLGGRLDPQLAGAQAERTVVVRGLAGWHYDHRDQPSVGTLVATMQALSGQAEDDRVSLFLVRVREGEDVPGVVGRLQALLPSVEVSGVDELVRHFHERMVYFRQLALILGTVSTVVAMLLVGTLLSITVNERLAELATLRALGVSRASVMRTVLLEGLVLVVLGGLAGMALGLVTARVLDRILTSFPGLPAAFSFFVPRGAALLQAFLLTLVPGALAALLPAWRAARAPIAATLRAEAT